MQKNEESLESFMHMLGSFTLLRLCNLLIQILLEDRKLTSDDLLKYNSHLNRIFKRQYIFNDICRKSLTVLFIY